MRLRYILFYLVLIMSVQAYAQVPELLTQEIVDGDNTYTLHMVKETLRGPNFNIKIQNNSGEYDSYTPGEVRTYIGTVDELDDAVAAGYLESDGTLWARIYLDRGWLWTVSGSSITGKVFREPTYSYSTTPTVEAGMGGEIVYEYEMGLDVDYDCYSKIYSSDAAKAFENIEKNMCEWKVIQLRDNMMKPSIGRVVLRASQQNCPFQGISGTALLSPFASEWANNQSDAMQYCFKAMLATTNIGGGVAYCPGSYNISQCKSTGWFMGAGRHELGHNFGCADYEGGSPEGPTINCGNGITRFCGPSVRDHLLHRNKYIGNKLYSIGGAYQTVEFPPYAALDLQAISCDLGRENQIRIDVLANDFDANADGLELLSFEETSNLGFSISRSEGTGLEGRDEILYTYRDNVASDRLDYVHYTVKDSSGKIATGLVLIKIHVTIPPLWAVQTDADTYVNGTTRNNYGSSASIIIKRSSAGETSSYTRTAWMHFTLPDRAVTGSAQLEFTLDSADVNSGTITVWGVNDGKKGDVLGVDWSESTITGYNAPYRPDFSEDENISLIGTFACSSTQDTFILSNAKLVSFLKQDSNGEVTFILTRNPNDGNFSIRSRENPAGGAAELSMMLVPSADTYVRSGDYADVNYGLDSGMIVKNDIGSYSRHALMRFDYNSKGTGTVNSGLLTLVPLTSQPTATLRVRLLDDADDLWGENSMTWNTEPVPLTGEVIFSGSDLVIGRPYEINVTDLLNQTGNSNGIASFIIDSPIQVQRSYTSFASKENEVAEYQPKLRVETDNMFVAGNLNLDDIVDFKDFEIIASEWLEEDCQFNLSCFGADLNSDNVVNLIDLNIMTGNWLQYN